jgi:hypothetical protein
MGKERKGASCAWFSLCGYSYVYVLLCFLSFTDVNGIWDVAVGH